MRSIGESLLFIQSHGMARLCALTDGVYAIVLTLLVLDLKIPDAPGLGEAKILDDLVIQIPTFPSCVIVFFVVATLWIKHNPGYAELCIAGGAPVKVAARVIGGDRRDADLRVLTNRRDHCERFLDRESIGRPIQIDLGHFRIEHVEIELKIDAVHTRGDVVERRCCVALGQRRSWSRMSLGQSILAWREAQARTEAAPIWLSGFAIGG